MVSTPGLVERIQEMAVRLIATSPAGQGLRLVGGLRYRMLDRSARTSVDIDYHWDGDLEEKADELLSLFRKKLLREVRRLLSHDGSACRATGQEAGSPFVATVDLAFFKPQVPGSRLEIPVDVTRVACLDPPVVRTLGGTIYLTASNSDMVESKAIALLQRVFLQARDIVDLFLFQDAFVADSDSRLRRKLASLSLAPPTVAESLARIRENLDVHARAVDRVLAEQMDRPQSENLRAAGGGAMICDVALRLLERLIASAPR
jgi:hypothetical protein